MTGTITGTLDTIHLSNLHMDGYRRLPEQEQRDHYVEGLINKARAGDTDLNDMLTDPHLLSRASFGNRKVHSPSMALLAQRYTKETWGVSIHDALNTHNEQHSGQHNEQHND